MTSMMSWSGIREKSDLKLLNGIHTLAALLVSGTALVKVGAFQHTVFMFKRRCSSISSDRQLRELSVRTAVGIGDPFPNQV